MCQHLGNAAKSRHNSKQQITNKQSYVAYRMALPNVTFSDFEDHMCCLKRFYVTYLGKYSVCLLRYVYK